MHKFVTGRVGIWCCSKRIWHTGGNEFVVFPSEIRPMPGNRAAYGARKRFSGLSAVSLRPCGPLDSVLFLPTLARTFRFSIFCLPTYLDMPCFWELFSLPTCLLSGVFLYKEAASRLSCLPTPMNLKCSSPTPRKKTLPWR
jgi:hypothetical protein